MPLQAILTGLQACPWDTGLADNNLDGMECIAHHPGFGDVADIVSVTMSLLSIKRTLQLLFSTRASLRMTHQYTNKD